MSDECPKGGEHDWRVIYTDDDQCKKCGRYRLWPGGDIVSSGFTRSVAEGTRISGTRMHAPAQPRDLVVSWGSDGVFSFNLEAAGAPPLRSGDSISIGTDFSGVRTVIFYDGTQRPWWQRIWRRLRRKSRILWEWHR